MGCTQSSGKNANAPEIVSSSSVEITEGGSLDMEAAEAEYQRKMHERRVQLSDHVKPLLEKTESIMNVSLVEQMKESDESEKLQMKKAQERQAAAMQQGAEDKSWVILNNLDALTDAQIEKLAKFKSVVMEFVPTLSNKTFQESLEKMDVKKQLSMEEAVSEGAETVKVEKNVEKLIKLHNIKVETVSKATSNMEKMGVELNDISLVEVEGADEYDVPPGPLNYQTACSILDIYKQGGRLCAKAVQRVLRAAYRSLHKRSNISRVNIESADEKLTVVGDLHGQLSDLIYIFEESGLPSRTNKYLFNGDFVDRGLMGMEITVLLMVFHAVLPDSFFLNRGNHEDYMIMCNYGFQEECISKYDETMFGMISEVFQYLPLFTIVNKAVLVVHGGLFHDVNAKIEDMDSFTRSEFSLLDIPDDVEETVTKEGDMREYYKQIQRDALWSDPCIPEGINESPRGAGVAFGPDVTARFLENNDLSLVVRSHECVHHGFDFPYKGVKGYENILCTLFSASNYGEGATNRGAYMEFRARKPGVNHDNTPTTHTTRQVVSGHLEVPVRRSPLSYTVHEYRITAEMEEMMREAFTAHSMSIHEIILRKGTKLLKAFRQCEVANQTGSFSKNQYSGYVPVDDWVRVMSEVTEAKLHWGSMIGVLVPPSSRNNATNQIQYVDFINQFTLDQQQFLSACAEPSKAGRRKSFRRSSTSNAQMARSTSVGDESGADRYDMIENLYAQYKELKLVFEFFDVRDCGAIDKNGFVQGCTRMNEYLPPESQVKDMEELFEIADLDGSSAIIANEFFEIFRIVDSRLPQPVVELPTLLEVEGDDEFDSEDESDDDTVVPAKPSSPRKLDRMNSMEIKGHLINAL